MQATLSALQLSLSLILLLCYAVKQNLYVSHGLWSFCCVLVSLCGSICTRFGNLQGASWCKSVRHSLVHVSHGNVGEPRNGCHDGPALCTPGGGNKWSKFPYMSACVHAQKRAFMARPSLCMDQIDGSGECHVQVFVFETRSVKGDVSYVFYAVSRWWYYLILPAWEILWRQLLLKHLPWSRGRRLFCFPEM